MTSTNNATYYLSCWLDDSEDQISRVYYTYSNRNVMNANSIIEGGIKRGNITVISFVSFFNADDRFTKSVLQDVSRRHLNREFVSRRIVLNDILQSG